MRVVLPPSPFGVRRYPWYTLYSNVYWGTTVRSHTLAKTLKSVPHSSRSHALAVEAGGTNGRFWRFVALAVVWFPAPKERTTASAFGRSKSLILTGAFWWGTPSQRTLVLSLGGPRLENLKHEVFETSKVSLIVTERVTLNMFNITCSVTIKHFMFTLKSKILSSIGAPRFDRKRVRSRRVGHWF